MTIRSSLSLIFAGSLFSFSACTQDFNKSKLDLMLNTLDTKHQGMGSIAISQNGYIVYQKSIGVGNTLPAGPKTRYRIGSITKMFTAVMVFQLIGENKIQLTTPLSAFFPQMPNAKKITIKMMLGHRSGLHDFTVDPALGTYYTKSQTHTEMLTRMASYKPDFEPDNDTEYSNTNFVLLGYIVERLTGKTYSENLKERITTKIGIANTFYGEQKDNNINDAKPFNWRNGHWEQTAETDLSIPSGAGAIVSTTSDMLEFIQALFDGKLVGHRQLELMKPEIGNFGLGMFKFDFFGHICFGHTGNIDGIFAEVCYFPKEKVSVAYFSNGGIYPRNEVLDGVMSIYFNRPYAIPTFKIARLDDNELRRYIGTYISKDTQLKIAITADDGVLSIAIPGQQAFPLQPVSNNTFESKMMGATFAFGTAQGMFTITQGNKTFNYSLER